MVADVFESAAMPNDEVTHVPGGAGVGVFVVSAMPLWPLRHVKMREFAKAAEFKWVKIRVFYALIGVPVGVAGVDEFLD